MDNEEVGAEAGNTRAGGSKKGISATSGSKDEKLIT